MPFYEVMTIASARSTAANLVTLMRRVSTEVVKRGGVVRGVDHLGVRPLAYRMKAHQAYHELGRYIRLRVEASPEALRELEHRLRVDEQVVRWLTIKRSTAPKDPPPVAGRKGTLTHLDPAVKAFLRKYSPVDAIVAARLRERGQLSDEEVKEAVAKVVRIKPEAASSSASA